MNYALRDMKRQIRGLRKSLSKFHTELQKISCEDDAKALFRYNNPVDDMDEVLESLLDTVDHFETDAQNDVRRAKNDGTAMGASFASMLSGSLSFALGKVSAMEDTPDKYKGKNITLLDADSIIEIKNGALSLLPLIAAVTDHANPPKQKKGADDPDDK